MAPVDDLDGVLQRVERAGNEFVNGNPLLVQKLFTHREDASLANAFGLPACGWDELAATMDRTASNLRGGGMVALEEVAKHVTPELAYTVWLEQQKAKVGAEQDVTPFTLRVTSIRGRGRDAAEQVHRFLPRVCVGS